MRRLPPAESCARSRLSAARRGSTRSGGRAREASPRSLPPRSGTPTTPLSGLNASPDLRLVAFNQAAEELTGWQHDEVLGEEMGLLVPERARAALMANARTYLESRDRGEFGGPMRLPVLRADGTERMVELTPVPLAIGGQPHFCGFLRDISELQSAHVALLDSEGRFRLLSQLAPVGIVQADLAGTCTYANDYWCELTGTTARQAVGASWSAAVHPGDTALLERRWAAAAAAGRELRTDCRLLPAHGDVV